MDNPHLGSEELSCGFKCGSTKS